MTTSAGGSLRMSFAAFLGERGPVLAAVAAVGDAALEAAHAHAAVELDAAQVHVLDPELLHVRLEVVVAAHAELRQPHAVERLEPRGLQVAEAEHEVEVVLGGDRAGVRVERPVGEGEGAHWVRHACTMCRLFGLHGGAQRVRACFWLLEAPDSLARAEPPGARRRRARRFTEDGKPYVERGPDPAYEDAEFARAPRGAVRRYVVRSATPRRRPGGAQQPPVRCRRAGCSPTTASSKGSTGSTPPRRPRSLVQGDTDSERFFALITSETRPRAATSARGSPRRRAGSRTSCRSSQ